VIDGCVVDQSPDCRLNSKFCGDLPGGLAFFSHAAAFRGNPAL